MVGGGQVRIVEDETIVEVKSANFV